MVSATQLLALIVCHAPPAFWQAHMDISKEGKKISKKGGDPLLSGKKEGLLRFLLTDYAYEDKSTRAALLGVLRLLVGGHALPLTLLGKRTEAEWWHETEAEAATAAAIALKTARARAVGAGAGGADGGVVALPEGSALLTHRMRTFKEAPLDMGPGAAPYLEGSLALEGGGMPKRPSGFGQLLGLGGGAPEPAYDEASERLRFVIEKLFQRKSSGRLVRLPKLLESGDVLVCILGQIGAHSMRVGEEAINLLLSNERDAEYNLLGVCALGRILKSPDLVAALRGKLPHFAERLQAVIARCEESVGAQVLGMRQSVLPVATLTAADDSVQVLLTSVTRKKDRDVAVRIAMYREALGCITHALPPSCLQQQTFVGELVLHVDDDLASMASRVIGIMARDQPARRKDILRCFGGMLTRLLSAPGGSQMRLRGQYHAVACEAMQAQLQTVVDHVTHLMVSWAEALPSEHEELETLEMEVGVGGSQVVRLEGEFAHIDASAIALLAHPSPTLRKSALAMAAAVKTLFTARKESYDRAVSERLAVLQSSVSLVSVEEAEREAAELRSRINRAERMEVFVADLLEREKGEIVRKAVKRELLESKAGGRQLAAVP